MAPDRTSRTRRRILGSGLALAGLCLLPGCGGLPVPGQHLPKPSRIGYLALNNTAVAEFEAFRDGLRELGYVEGHNIAIETRLAESFAQFPALASELVGLPVDLLLTAGGLPASHAAMGATSTIPIVFAGAPDPVRAGLVASLARPGGNVTGLSIFAPQIAGKRLQLLRDLAPNVSRVMLVTHTADAVASGNIRESQEAAQSLGLQLLVPNIHDEADLLAAFELAVVDRADALLVTGHPLIMRERIIDFATTTRLPLLAQDHEFTVAGGLLSYGPDRVARYRRAATYVHKILQGAKPGDLPVEQPTQFEFVLNLKTAQALGLTIPQQVLQQATEIIQ